MAAIVAIILSAVLFFTSTYETKVGAVMLAICVGAFVKFTEFPSGKAHSFRGGMKARSDTGCLN